MSKTTFTVIQDDRHIETKQAIKGVKLGQEIEALIHFREEVGRENKKLSFADHDFGKWCGGRLRREEIYRENGR